PAGVGAGPCLAAQSCFSFLCLAGLWETHSLHGLSALQVEPQACTYPCQCPSQPLQCPAGTSHVLDACGCCKVCARQLGELCSLQKPCDHHKGLYCDFSKIHRGSGICLAHEGATCDLLGKIYHNGESFQPTCKLQCICMDGAIGCIPLCSDDLRLPSPECPNPRRVKFRNKCCEEWICEEGSEENLTPGLELVLAAHFVHWEGLLQTRLGEISVMLGGGSHTLGYRSRTGWSWAEENCLVQTTEWSACSKSCGMGISARVTNDNPQCRLEKETRLCMVRPCDFPVEKTKKGKKCVRTPKPRQSLHFEFSGCTSTRSYRPKFCGSCTDGRCCTPYVTSTVEVEFRCPEGDFFQRKMMFIKMCSCHYDCPRDNDIFLATYHRRMIGDHVKTERQ
uniref:CCN family member 3 n=1 Tax=Bubo bubo TaxID=30461 RepID=A0A8C0FF85_BUBBB